MKNILSVSVILLAALLFTSCEKVVDIDLETSKSKPVIEGLVANRPGMSYVKISMSGSYFKVNEPSPVSGASVEVTDDDGNEIIFTELTPGYYVPSAAFAGKAGQNYSLKVMISRKTYLARSFMREVTEIETITTKFFEDNNQEGKEEGYYAYVSFTELPGEGDSYRIDIYANGRNLTELPGDIFYFNDRFVDGGHAVEWEFVHTLAKGDSITMNMHSLTREGYEFYDAIYQIANAGGLFGKNPANIPTNIQGDAFGYFGASAISTKSIIVE